MIQGVGFRPFVYRLAKRFNLKGYVRNTSGGVEILIDGNKVSIKNFLDYLKNKPPALAQIESIDVREGYFGTFTSFSIIKSSKQPDISTLIPPDMGICEDCLRELHDKENRRFGYYFITCTNCGPRFTLIKEIPYDRIRTTMEPFKMCPFCESQYKNPLDRRYNAQTTSCPECGPKLSLFDRKGKVIRGNSIEKAMSLINRGKILAIKGVGGVHLTCLTTDDKIIKKLRRRRGKPQKPFAIMAEKIEMIKSFAIVNRKEEELLKSWQRPIVLLKKSKDYWLSEYLSPGLHNIGVMLPYSGLHYLLFEKIEEPLVMTSANLPDEPTIKDEKEAFEKLSSVADYFLIHDREIYQRCDDSVVRVIDDKPVLLRRSRGYTPLPIDLNVESDEIILALGAELDDIFCIYRNGKAYLSQHIGDTSNYDTFLDLKQNLNKWMKLLSVDKFDRIVCDLHPRFNTTKLAEELSEKYSCGLTRVQHHFAHLASCMAEYGLKEAIGIICDGYGFGLDKKAWGGEVLVIKNGKFERVGHLEYQLLIGGDLATKYPLRIVIAILSKFMDETKIRKTTKQLNLRIPEQNIKVWFKQLESEFNVIESSSCGRFLDAVSALLGVCSERTYEGEPAMKLESLALKGKKLIELPVKVKRIGGEYVLDTTSIFEETLNHIDKTRKEDLALSVHYTVAEGLSKIVKKVMRDHKIKAVCFSGGCAYNELLNKFLSEKLKILAQSKAPCGDGGISLGQVYYKFLSKS
jgi:hydrogenase maturation protein HypF